MFSCGVTHCRNCKNQVFIPGCHNFSTICVIKIHLCCGAWSIFVSGWKNAEAHLIVLVLEALNLVLKPMPGYVCSVTPTCHQLLVQCRSVWRILVSCWSLSAATVHAAHQLVPPVLKRKRQTREENISYRFTVHHRCKRYYLNTQNRNAVFWICKLPHKALDCKVMYLHVY